MKTLLAALLTVFMLTNSAFAQRAVDCPGQTLEHAQCAHEAYQEADARLNKVWKRVNKNLDPAFPEEAEAKAGLLRSQRAWIIYRDAECEGSIGALMGRGTGRPGAEAICKEQMTVDRIRVLEDRYGSP